MTIRLLMLRSWIGFVFLVFACTPSQPAAPIQQAHILAVELPSDSTLLYGLKPDIPQLARVYRFRERGHWDAALEELAAYYRRVARDRYYFDWQNFGSRLDQYETLYPERMGIHDREARKLRAKFGADPAWKLPSQDLQGKPVTAYELRHLARQSRAPAMAITYFSEPDQADNLAYFLQQRNSLNRAYGRGEVDTGGNAIYEAFRAGKRIHHWLFMHHAYLNSPEYIWQEQIETIRTLLHHAAVLQETAGRNRYGNHHTRGMVALFEIASQYPEFVDSENWLERALDGITWHIEHEINDDGFQFERSIHYHKGDIENYFRVVQLARNGGIPLVPGFMDRFQSMFDALVKLAQPDGNLPVLQDDTDGLHAETNALGDVMALAALLFPDQRIYGSFAWDHVDPLFYWLIRGNRLQNLATISGADPDFGSTALESTGYYIMRNGWQPGKAYMVITAGLSERKPDHQHADMLGLVAYADGHEILPNYQVKYNEPDFPFWKGSWVKNVALVDSLTQAQQWKGNRGGSGFGKWLDLPEPHVIQWMISSGYDYFMGGHDAYVELGVDYTREIVFLKQAQVWIVRDRFTNPEQVEHEFQQVWQGLFETRTANRVEREFGDAEPLTLIALDGPPNMEWRHGRFRGKGNVLRVQRSSAREQALTTMILSGSANPRRIHLIRQTAHTDSLPDWVSGCLEGELFE